MRKTIGALALFMLGYLVLITYWALNGRDHLPERVPTHFDISGRPNAWGSPAILWILPAVGAGLYLLFTALASIQPGTFKLPVRVTEVNLSFIQEKTSEMAATIRTEIMCLFVYLQSGIIHGARIGEFRLSPATVPVFMVVIFATLGIYAVVIIRGARERAESAATVL
jgi:uncharacterized membrane protein